MKLLLFSDLHCSTSAARSLVEKAAGADVLVGAGDFASVRRGIDICLDILKTVDKPAVLVPGNNESLDELQSACRDWPQAHVLHGNGTTVLGQVFYGLGGGVPVTPFGSWSFDFSEDQARAFLANCPPAAVLISHSPPKGAVDVDSSGRSLGSVAVAECIEQTAPVLVVCGHIHASAGRHKYLGTSPVVNAGPAGISWELAGT